MTELEKKLLLTEDEYNYLMEHLGFEGSLIQKPITTQINYYFDTDDFSMDRQNTTCRIRFKNGKYKATMKKHSSDGDQSTETEMEIRNGLKNNAFTDMGLKLQGELITERCIILQDGICEVALDKNKYLGCTDFELEVEYLPMFEHHADRVLGILMSYLVDNTTTLTAQNANNYLPNAHSKSKRFFERYSSNKRRKLYESSS